MLSRRSHSRDGNSSGIASRPHINPRPTSSEAVVSVEPASGVIRQNPATTPIAVRLMYHYPEPGVLRTDSRADGFARDVDAVLPGLAAKMSPAIIEIGRNFG